MLTEKRRVIGLFESLTLQWEEAEYPPHSLYCEKVGTPSKRTLIAFAALARLSDSGLSPSSILDQIAHATGIVRRHHAEIPFQDI
jgi:hypothetical protein